VFKAAARVGVESTEREEVWKRVRTGHEFGSYRGRKGERERRPKAERPSIAMAGAGGFDGN
jgi:hypothetical protein